MPNFDLCKLTNKWWKNSEQCEKVMKIEDNEWIKISWRMTNKRWKNGEKYEKVMKFEDKE